jgi:hypothetical protein
MPQNYHKTTILLNYIFCHISNPFIQSHYTAIKATSHSNITGLPQPSEYIIGPKNNGDKLPRFQTLTAFQSYLKGLFNETIGVRTI